MALIDERLAARLDVLAVEIPVIDGARLAWVYRHAEVLHREDTDTHVRLQLRLSEADKARFEQL